MHKVTKSTSHGDVELRGSAEALAYIMELISRDQKPAKVIDVNNGTVTFEDGVKVEIRS